MSVESVVKTEDGIQIKVGNSNGAPTLNDKPEKPATTEAPVENVKVSDLDENYTAEVVSEDTPAEEEKGEDTNEAAESENNVTIISAGDKRCYVYFKTKFTSLKKDADLLSIAFIDYDGRSFYAEFTDYDIQKVDEWTFSNVVKRMKKPANVLDGDHWTMTGTKKEVRTQLFFWLDKFVKEDRPVQFVCDCGHYDFVLLIDLLTDGESAVVLPSWISPALYDVNQDLGTSLYRNNSEGLPEEEFNKNYIPNAVAFTITRTDAVKENDRYKPDEVYTEYHALHDAYIVKVLHQTLWNL